MSEKNWRGWQVGMYILFFAPHYKILLCADYCIPPSPWTDRFRVEIDRRHKVIRLSGEFT